MGYAILFSVMAVFAAGLFIDTRRNVHLVGPAVANTYGGMFAAIFFACVYMVVRIVGGQ